VCDGLEVGSIVDVVVTASTSGAVRVLCGVLFPSLKKSVLWPLECLDVVVPSALIAMKADSVGPVYSIAAMSKTRIATGGADRSVKVWEWAKGVYSVVQSATRHTDLVKQVIAVRRPDVFMSSSYDGTVREWHMYDTPQPFLNCQNTTVVSVGAREASSGGDVQPVGVVDYFPAFNALFAAPLFDTRIKTYTLMETQGCELPPNMLYDGERTCRIADPPTTDEATPATGAIADVLQQVSSE
jgi:WD40 repeat protein